MFENIQTVIARFLDIDHVLSMCVQIPKQETLKTAEANINNIIYLKHILELVDPLRNALSNCENRLMKHFYKVVLLIKWICCNCFILLALSELINKSNILIHVKRFWYIFSLVLLIHCTHVHTILSRCNISYYEFSTFKNKLSLQTCYAFSH